MKTIRYSCFLVSIIVLLAACNTSENPVSPNVSPQVAYVCPVNGHNDFEDTWGDARSEGRTHQGTDLMAAEGTPLVAIIGGTIRNIKWNDLGGNTISFKGDDGFYYYYAHLSGYAENIGERVTQGQLLGYVGQTGSASGPHLHFSMRSPEYDDAGHGDFDVNPYPYLLEWCNPPEPPAPPAPPATGWPTLALGSSDHSLVMTFQYLMNANGAGLAVDGDFGPQTEAAVKFIQGLNGWEPTGIVGENEWRSVIAAFALQQGSQGDAVKALQQRLTDKGYLLDVDGDFGPVTAGVVWQFQQDLGLVVDGLVGPQTWQTLFN
jgi:Peptidase family M23/Putative peptidoglycan binding domain